MPNYFYVQQVGGEKAWKPLPASSSIKYINENKPEFVTVLAVSKIVDDLESAERDKLSYAGPMYFDFDSKDLSVVISKFNQFLDKLVDLALDLDSVRIFATGGKGFHLEIPQLCFMSKLPKTGVANLPTIYREVALELCVDTLDLRVYSQGRGRMWRVPNNERANGKFKVPVTVTEVREMTVDNYYQTVSQSRALPQLTMPTLCIDLTILFDKAVQKVEEKVKARGKRKKDPNAKAKAHCTSIQMMMAGLGIKQGVGFHEIALQIAVSCTAAGLTEAQMLSECEGIIETHDSDGTRYNTPAKRRTELVRMFAYCDDNPCYEFSVGAVKSLLDHAAPDLDGMSVTKEDIAEAISEAKDHAAAVANGEVAPDEFEDTSGGVTLSKFGVYVDSEFGKKRVCAVSFRDIHLLLSTETGQMCGYEAEVLVNGRPTGRQTMELDTFSSVQIFNRFAARLGHALQGVETHVRGLMMRFVELAKKKGRMRYIAKREGLDVINIPNHENIELREHFMVWADGRGIILDPRINPEEIDMSFQGFPDPRGLFKSDLADAPKLADWILEGSNKEDLRVALNNMITCQKAEVVAKMLGWYTASIYRMLFHKAYGQFPILHVNGPAGSGKCLGRNTPVLLSTGDVIMVQDVKVGDQLLGPDGGVRNVLGTCSGRSQLYRVTPIKGDSYVVNDAHILSMRKSEKDGCLLSDGRHVLPDEDIVNVNVETWLHSGEAARKTLKGWRAPLVEFTGEKEDLLLDPYWLGAWLGDGNSTIPALHKPECNMTRWWVAHAELHGHKVTLRGDAGCAMWAVTRHGGAHSGPRSDSNVFLRHLKTLNLLKNKHIPKSYLHASSENRLQLLAGLLDSDGHVANGGYDWISKDEQMANDFAFLCRSLGFACYVKECRKGIKKLGFMGTYWRCYVSGDCERVPCKDKVANKRQQVKRHLVHGISVEPIGEGDYYGFEIDGDKLFLLGDFTVTHNTTFNQTLMSLFYYNQEPKMLTPGSTLFAVQQHMAGSASIPLLLDEYKPQEMGYELHAKYKLLIRDAYNCRAVAKGGGTRESDDYRKLHETNLAAPLVVIAEAAEEEAAVSERVVLVTMNKPPNSISTTWAVRFQAWQREKKCMAILGQWLVGQAIFTSSVPKLREEFDPLYQTAREKYLLNEADLTKKLSDQVLIEKQNAKERSVFNFTVSKFGLLKFKTLVESIFGQEFAALFKDMEEGIYTRMSDLHSATQAEWAKVLSMMSIMSHHADDESPVAMNLGHDYAFVEFNGQPCIEIAMRSSYLKYRSFCRQSQTRALYNGDQSFMHAIKDCPALVHHGRNHELDSPGTYTFYVEELVRLGVEPFRG